VRQALATLELDTQGPGLLDVTGRLEAWLAERGAREGLLTLFLQHTSASLLVQENADPAVQADLLAFLARLAPEGPGYTHRSEGPDDMPAHLKAALTATSLGLPVLGGHLALGTWQAVYLAEHRRGAHRRRLVVHFVGA
jgi:secondary thiamine-phosphate synthase enzyme